jgi:hypothetical protein
MISSGWGQKPVTDAVKCKETELAEQLLASQKTLQSVQLVTSLQENSLKFVNIIEFFVTPVVPKSNSDLCSA